MSLSFNAAKRTIPIVCGVPAVAAAVLVAFLPPSYSTTSAIALDNPRDASLAEGLSQVTSPLVSGVLRGRYIQQNGFTYIDILRSRTTLTHLLELRRPASSRTYFQEFAPRSGAPPKRWDAAVRRLSSSILIEFSTRSSVLRLTVRSKEPRLAAELATLLIDELTRFEGEVRATRAREAVRFIDARTAEARNTLTQAEDRLAAFRATNLRIGNSPSLRLQENRLERAVRLAEDLYSLLIRQLELARIREKEEASVFTVIERPSVPVRPATFSPLAAAIVAAIVSLAVYLLLLALRSYFAKHDPAPPR